MVDALRQPVPFMPPHVLALTCFPGGGSYVSRRYGKTALTLAKYSGFFSTDKLKSPVKKIGPLPSEVNASMKRMRLVDLFQLDLICLRFAGRLQVRGKDKRRTYPVPLPTRHPSLLCEPAFPNETRRCSA